MLLPFGLASGNSNWVRADRNFPAHRYTLFPATASRILAIRRRRSSSGMVTACLERSPRKRPASATLLAQLGPFLDSPTAPGGGHSYLTATAMNLIENYRQWPALDPADPYYHRDLVDLLANGETDSVIVGRGVALPSRLDPGPG